MSSKSKENTKFRAAQQLPVTIQLKIGDEMLSVDKDALIAGSPYFAAMLGGNFQEATTSVIEFKQPDNVHLGTVVQLVESLSDGTSTLSIKRKDAVKVWMAARYLQMGRAEKRAAKILDSLMQRPEHAYRLWRLARRDRLFDLEKLTFPKILQKFPRHVQFSDSEWFSQCSVDEVTDLLTHDDYVPDCEASVYEAVLRWCMHGAAERKEHLRYLLDACIVWDDLDIKILIETATAELHEALTQILADRQRGMMGGGALLKRAAPKEAIFYHMRDGHPHQLLRFDFIRNELTKLNTPVQEKLAEHWPKIKADGFAVAVGRELIVGTTPYDAYSDELVAIDCVTGCTRALMKESPFNECMCVVAVGSQIFGADDADNNDGTRNWYSFDVPTGQLRRASQLPQYTFEKEPTNYTKIVRANSDLNYMDLFKLQLLQDRLYGNVAGVFHRYYRASMEGYPLPHGRIVFVSVGCVREKHDGYPESVVETYDIRSNQWTKHTSWTDDSKFHHQCGIIVFQGYLYFTGGCRDVGNSFYRWKENGTAVTACYRVSLSHAQAEPERIADLNVARYQHCVFIKDGQIWVYGGTTHVDGDNQRKRALMSFERYSAEENRWTVVDVPMTKELQAEVAGGDYAQKTVCLPLQHYLPPVYDGRKYVKYESSDTSSDSEDMTYHYRMKDEYNKEPGSRQERDSKATEWPAGLDD
ncbi:kelch-like protein 17 [Paramacrobiotus metropolitanus]|uniref:kelch-like protein 17 n=1 Tax=Paramacrobiotus metropolitanus TaxID=2943436 RepID=UPI0024460F4B|nr:kelch-like protein 17 [Paramacrobiotus metropolitanus]